MARPKLPAHQQRKNRVVFYLDDAELAKAQAEIKTLGFSSVHEYARICTTGGRIKIITTEGFPFEAVHQIKRLGNVIWQALRHARETGAPLPPFEDIAREIDNILTFAFSVRLNGRSGDNRQEL